MSDDPDLAADAADDTPTEVREDVEATTPPPWGDDFNPERAWKTITSQRDRERELEPDAKAYQRLKSGEDMDTFKELAQHYGYELDEEPDEPDPTGDPYEQRFSQVEKTQQEFQQFLAEQRQKERFQAFQSQVNELAEKQEFELSPRDWEIIARDADARGGDEKAIAAAFKDHSDYIDGLTRGAVDQRVKSKQAPRVQSSGKQATQVPDLDDPAARVKWMTEQYNARTQQ